VLNLEAVEVRESSLLIAEVRRLIYSEEERFSTDLDEIALYLAETGDADRILALVKPRSAEEINGLISMANRTGLAIYTPMPFGLEPERQGIIVDQSLMDRVWSLDPKRLFGVIEPGVTWEQLLPQVEALSLRMALPAAARHHRVLGTYQEKDIVLMASRYTNKQISNIHLVLADGRDYKSGSHANPPAEENFINWREDGGPNISKLMLGSQNMFGLPYKGFVYLYPYFEARRVTVLGFGEEAAALKAAQFISRREMAVECLALNKAKAEAVTGASAGAPWLTVASLEGSADLVEYYRRRIDEELAAPDEMPELASAFEEAFRSPWDAPDGTVGFYTLFSHVEEFDSLVGEEAPRMVIPVKRGASVYNHYELPGRPNMDMFEKLLDAGAFFSNPTGSLAHALYRRTGGYDGLVRVVKRRIDPHDIMNPGQVIEGGDE
jgi:FAD binding domain